MPGYDSDRPPISPTHPLEEPASRPSESSDEPSRIPFGIEDWLTVLIMALLACMTFGNVLVRYFTDGSFAWTEEISVFLMLLLALVAGSAAAGRDRHIRIEYFAQGGTAVRRRRLARFGTLMVVLLFFLMAVLSLRLVWDDIRYGETSPGIGVPQWWYSAWLPLCSLAIALRALGRYRRLGRSPEEAP